MDNEQNIFSRIDYTLIFIVFLLFCVSLIAIHSAPLDPSLKGINFVVKQVEWYIISSVFVVLLMFLDYDRLRNIHWYLYGFGVFLLLGLTITQLHLFSVPFATSDKGAFSWYTLPGIGSIQPSEFMKIFLVLSIGHTIAKHNETYKVRTIGDDFRLLGKIILVCLIPVGLIFIQPDLGTTMVLVAMVFSMILVSGIRWRIIFGLIALSIGGIALLVLTYIKFPTIIKHYVLKKHQLDRFYGWLAPNQYSNDQGFQLLKSLNNIGTGQLYGNGINHLPVFLPEAHTDFIFAVIAGSFGFIGAAVVISLFFLLIYRMIHTALGTHDPFGSYICAGIIGMIMFQVFQNIGMTIQVMPITGITLPFLSYGGSSLLTNMLSIGLVLNIQSRTKKYMFD